MMKLGIISGWTKECFEKAQARGLGFVQFCIDGGPEEFLAMIPEILEWVKETGIEVGALSRRGAAVVDPEGRLLEGELETAISLIDACGLLGCPVMSLGCNYIEEVSLLKNVENAARYLSLVAGYAGEKEVKIAAHNAGQGNFVHSDPVWELLLGEIPGLYIEYDPSNALYRGQDYLLQTAKWGSRFAHVRLKGALRIAGQKFGDPPAGLDSINWPAFIACLHERGYSGGLSVDPPSKPWGSGPDGWGVNYTISHIRPMIYAADQREVGE